MKNNLVKNDFLINVDYSESYKNKQQREIQSAYFSHTTFSICSACCYCFDATNNRDCKLTAITSDFPDHSRAPGITRVLKVIEHLREKHQHLPLTINAIILSDGSSAQFRSRFVFKLLSTVDASLNITWCYSERRHETGPMDGNGGTLKNCIYTTTISWSFRQNDHWHNITLSRKRRSFSRVRTLHIKWSFSLRISSVNVTKYAENCTLMEGSK